MAKERRITWKAYAYIKAGDGSKCDFPPFVSLLHEFNAPTKLFDRIKVEWQRETCFVGKP